MRTIAIDSRCKRVSPQPSVELSPRKLSHPLILTESSWSRHGTIVALEPGVTEIGGGAVAGVQGNGLVGPWEDHHVGKTK